MLPMIRKRRDEVSSNSARFGVYRILKTQGRGIAGLGV